MGVFVTVSDRLTKCTFKHKNKGQKQFDMQPVKISIAVMFVDEGVVSNTVEAALLLNSCRMRQQHDGGQKKNPDTEAERRRDTKGDRLKVIKGWQITSVGNISGTEHIHTYRHTNTHT